jgi:hypothetical protein
LLFCFDLKTMLKKQRLVNGSRGVVIGFTGHDGEVPKDLSGWFSKNGNTVPVVRFASGEPLLVTPRESTCDGGNDSVAFRVQLPLALCWATTV